VLHDDYLDGGKRYLAVLLENSGVAMEFLVIGLIAGVLSGLFGIGGGVVIVPALIMVSQMKPETATGTSLASLLLPVGVLGAWHYYRHGFVEVAPAALIATGLVIGAWLGAFVALRLSAQDLQKAFAIFLVFVAGHLWFTAR
jgi:uncharacterized membrane protein YfcA